MSDIYDGRVPGVGSTLTAGHRQIVLKDEIYSPGLFVLNGTLSRDVVSTNTADLRAGHLVGRITATGLIRPSIIGVTTAAVASGATSITVGAALATEIARLRTVAGGNIDIKITGPSIAGGVVNTNTVACSAASGTTLTVAATTNIFISGSFITPADGSENAISVLTNGNGYPLRVVDADNASRNMQVSLLAGGLLDSSMLCFWPSDTALRSYIVTRLTVGGQGAFRFDHLLGQ